MNLWTLEYSGARKSACFASLVFALSYLPSLGDQHKVPHSLLCFLAGLSLLDNFLDQQEVPQWLVSARQAHLGCRCPLKISWPSPNLKSRPRLLTLRDIERLQSCTAPVLACSVVAHSCICIQEILYASSLSCDSRACERSALWLCLTANLFHSYSVILFPMVVTFYIAWWFLDFFDGFFSPLYEATIGFHVFGKIWKPALRH